MSREDWRRRARTALFWAIVVELALVALFGVLWVRESTSWPALVVSYFPRPPLVAATACAALLAPLTRRRVKVLVAANVVATIFVVVFVAGLRLGSARPSASPIRLASYNVFFGNLGRPLLATEVVAMVQSADVVVLQAAYRGMHEDIEPLVGDRFLHHDDEFMLISRFRIAAVELPPSLSDGSRTMYVDYLLETDRGPLRIVSVHPFSPRPALLRDEPAEGNVTLRNEQIERAVAAARNGGAPFVVVGDTNLPSNGATSRRVFGGLHDAFEDVGSGFGFTFPASSPWLRIDRALGSDRIQFDRIRVGSAGASDHRPIFVDLEVR